METLCSPFVEETSFARTEDEDEAEENEEEDKGNCNQCGLCVWLTPQYIWNYHISFFLSLRWCTNRGISWQEATTDSLPSVFLLQNGQRGVQLRWPWDRYRRGSRLICRHDMAWGECAGASSEVLFCMWRSTGQPCFPLETPLRLKEIWQIQIFDFATSCSL